MKRARQVLESPDFFPQLISKVNRSVEKFLIEFPETTLIEFPPFSTLKEDDVMVLMRNIIHLDYQRHCASLLSQSYADVILSKEDAIKYVSNLYPTAVSLLFFKTVSYIKCQEFILTAGDFLK